MDTTNANKTPKKMITQFLRNEFEAASASGKLAQAVTEGLANAPAKLRAMVDFASVVAKADSAPNKVPGGYKNISTVQVFNDGTYGFTLIFSEKMLAEAEAESRRAHAKKAAAEKKPAAKKAEGGKKDVRKRTPAEQAKVDAEKAAKREAYLKSPAGQREAHEAAWKQRQEEAKAAFHARTKVEKKPAPLIKPNAEAPVSLQ
jgi:hypothetical protein